MVLVTNMSNNNNLNNINNVESIIHAFNTISIESTNALKWEATHLIELARIERNFLSSIQNEQRATDGFLLEIKKAKSYLKMVAERNLANLLISIGEYACYMEITDAEICRRRTDISNIKYDIHRYIESVSESLYSIVELVTSQNRDVSSLKLTIYDSESKRIVFSDKLQEYYFIKGVGEKHDNPYYNYVSNVKYIYNILDQVENLYKKGALEGIECFDNFILLEVMRIFREKQE